MMAVYQVYLMGHSHPLAIDFPFRDLGELMTEAARQVSGRPHAYGGRPWRLSGRYGCDRPDSVCNRGRLV